MNLTQYLDAPTLERWDKLIGQSQRIAILGHAGPDGDAMGSILALTHYLRKMGKKAVPIVPNPCPDFLRWLPGIQSVISAINNPRHAMEILHNCELVVCLDFSGYDRLEDIGDRVSQLHKPVIVIDHHLAPQIDADILISNPAASATCEILSCLLHQADPSALLDNNIATCLYCGIMTDTGAFAYNSNRAELYHITALLLESGIDKDQIYRNVYYNYSEQRMRLVGYLLNEKMTYLSDIHTAIYTLTVEEMKRYHFVRGDAEGIVNMPLQIKGTKLSISMREDTEKPIVRISLRSIGDFPCNKMAEEFFNGGGHKNASGGTLPKPIEEAYKTALKAIEAYRDQLI